MTVDDLDSIQKQGLFAHVRNGGTPPSKEFVQDFQNTLKEFAESPKATLLTDKQKFMGEDAIILKNKLTGRFVAINPATKNLISGYHLNPNQTIIHDATGEIGTVNKT